MARYSRFESLEEKRNFRNATILIILTVGVVALLFVYGIPLVGRVASFVSGLRGNASITLNDKTPPVPPSFNIFPDFTNQQEISISGTAEPGATAKLNLNNKDQETLVDKDGNFVFQNISLQPDNNIFSAVAVDTAGNTSQRTSDKTISYDIKPPDLTIDSPADGTKFFGNTQRQISIQGTTEGSTSATINNRVVSVDSNGKFQYPVTLNSGDNTFNIKITDQAGNLTEKNIIIHFSE